MVMLLKDLQIEVLTLLAGGYVTKNGADFLRLAVEFTVNISH